MLFHPSLILETNFYRLITFFFSALSVCFCNTTILMDMQIKLVVDGVTDKHESLHVVYESFLKIYVKENPLTRTSIFTYANEAEKFLS